jgi:hypothetical protein
MKTRTTSQNYTINRDGDSRGLYLFQKSFYHYKIFQVKFTYTKRRRYIPEKSTY